jgi:hypothetical protein
MFRIDRYGDATKGYKLVWCTDERPCKDLGLYASKGKNWLVTSISPLAVGACCIDGPFTRLYYACCMHLVVYQ